MSTHSVYLICHLHLILYKPYVTYTSFCIHHMSLTPHSVYIDVYRMRCKWHMMYTEWGVSEIWCIQNEVWHMMYTSYVTYTSFCIHHMSPHSVYIICHLILYTSYVTYTSFCIHHMSLTSHSVYIICHLHLILHTSYVNSFMMYTEWGDIWCIQNEVTYDVYRMRW
jgi:hypothetical protein